MSQINKPNTYFNTVLYSGTGSSNSVTGVGFQPDLVWIKERNGGAYNHNLFDVVRGVLKTIQSNNTGAEQNATTALSSFNTDGFTLGTDIGVNENGTNFASWNWLAGGTAVSNTDGSITSSVSANTTAGFSIVSYTGNGSNADQTLGTGLSTALDFIIVKSRDAGSGTDNWVIYSSALNMTQNQCLLFTTDALITGAAAGTPNRGSTAGQLKLLAGTSSNQNLNTNSLNYIAYCFHSVKGFSKFGKYTGNGSTDGTFVYTGFKPAFILVKNTQTTVNSWEIHDNKRDTFNVGTKRLYPNASASEGSGTYVDMLSNGFKWRSTDGGHNSANTFIYMAFAENPLTGTNGVPCTAR